MLKLFFLVLLNGTSKLKEQPILWTSAVMCRKRVCGDKYGKGQTWLTDACLGEGLCKGGGLRVRVWRVGRSGWRGQLLGLRLRVLGGPRFAMWERGGGRGGGGRAMQRAVNPGVWRLLRACTFTGHRLIIRRRGRVWQRAKKFNYYWGKNYWNIVIVFLQAILNVVIKMQK